MAEDYVLEYERHWKRIVELPDGSLNRDQIMRELADYSMVMRQVSLAYDEVTGGRISKPHTMAHHVAGEVEERCQEALHELAKEIADRLLAEGAGEEAAKIALDVGGVTEGQADD